MKPRRALPVLALGILLALMVWLFVQVIWIPLYADRQTATFAAGQEDPGIQAEIEREDGTGKRSWSLMDQQALARLRDGFRAAEFTREKPPQADQRFRVRIRRSDARVDEYEVLLDSRSSEHDMLYVVQRSGAAPIYGSAFKTPGLRSALQQIMKEPQPVSK